MADDKDENSEAAAQEEEAEGKKPKSSRLLLIAAAVPCLLSLGGGFYLARMAFSNDAAAYEPEYVDEKKDDKGDEKMAKKEGGDGEKMAKKGQIVDPLAKDGHPDEDAIALKDKKYDKKKDDGKKGKDGEDAVVEDNGLLEFADILTNIQGFAANGAPVKAFLKMNIIVVYRTDEGASTAVRERQPFMRDVFNAYLRGLTESDVRGMAGLLQVKSELLKRARAAVGSDLPQEILISDLIIQ